MNKQIEEMERDLRHCHYVYGDEYMELHTDYRKTAENLRNFGYRKIPTNDWLTRGISKEQLEREKQEALDEFAKRNGYCKVSEIFEEIERLLSANMSGEFRGDSVEWFDYFDLHLAEDIAELKKKYESEGVE